MKEASFGACLKRALRDQGLKPASFARIMDVHPQQVSEWLNKDNVTTKTESRVADKLGLTMAEFWSYNDQGYYYSYGFVISLGIATRFVCLVYCSMGG